MNAVQIQAWKPKRAKRRVALPIVALVNAALIEVAANQAKADMTQANRVYSAITEHIPRMRLVIVRNIPTE